MSDMASTACGRAGPGQRLVQRPAQVRLPAFVHVSYDALSVSRCGSALLACPGLRATPLCLPPLWESLQVFASQASGTCEGGHERSPGAFRCPGC